MKLSITLLLFCFCLIDLPAQTVDDALFKEAEKLKESFKEDEIAAIKSTVTHEYFVDPIKGLLIREKEKSQYVSIKSNATIILRNYFNDHVSIESYSIKNEKGKKIVHNTICGHSVSEGIFYSDGQICSYQAHLSTLGQTAFYENSILYNDPKYLTQVFFNEATPSKLREIAFIVPDGVNIELVEMNFTGFNIMKTETKLTGSTTYSYKLEMVEAIAKDEHLPGYLHIMPHVLVLCKSYVNKGVVTSVLSSTDDLYNWYASLTARLNTDYETLKPKVAELTQGLTSDEAKMKAIYYWVQDNIKYIAFEDGIAGFKPEDAKEVFYKRYGDCKGMANLMKSMLSVAGLDARLTWIGTDKIPYTYNLPTLAVDNHMICTVMSDGKQYILDATEKYNPFGSYAERIQGKEILIENGKGYLLSKVPNEPIEHYLEESLWRLNIKDKDLKGVGKTTIAGEDKNFMLYFLSTLKADEKERLLRRFIAGGANPDQFKILGHNTFTRDSSMSIQSEVTLGNHVYSNGKELYLDMDFKDDYKDAQMKKGRKMPYRFDSRIFKRTRTELTIPKGYKISYLPEALHIKNKHYEFDLGYESFENKVIYSGQIKILNNTLPIGEFENWNKAIQDVKKFYNNQVILKEND